MVQATGFKGQLNNNRGGGVSRLARINIRALESGEGHTHERASARVGLRYDSVTSST